MSVYFVLIGRQGRAVTGQDVRLAGSIDLLRYMLGIALLTYRLPYGYLPKGERLKTKAKIMKYNPKSK
jgi:hypothetical protein